MRMTVHDLLLCDVMLVCFYVILYLMSDFNIASLNLRGGRDVKKRTELYELMRLKHIDVMFLQETHSDKENESRWMMEWEGEAVLSSLSSVSAGVGILFAKHFIPESYTTQEIVAGRLMLVEAKYELFNLVFINIYAPTNGPERVLLLSKLCELLSSCDFKDYLFLGGDFNCTQNDLMDRNHTEPHAASKHILTRLIKTHDLVDVWRRQHGNERQYTWVHCRDDFISLARLDRFYCFKHNFNVFKTSQMTPVSFSDHFLVRCRVFIANFKHRSAYWHFNVSLLNDANFIESFRFFWTSFRKEKRDFSSYRQWWDHGKILIQQLCQEYTANVTRDITKSLRELEIDIVELQALTESTGNRGHFENLKAKKALMADLLGTKAQGALVRSRFKGVNEIDAPSGYFFGLEKKNGQSGILQVFLAGTGGRPARSSHRKL